MHSDFWKKLNEQFDRIHLQDTEIKTKSGTIYINPNLKLILGWLIFMILVVIFLVVCKPFSKKIQTVKREFRKRNRAVQSWDSQMRNFSEMNILR